MHPHQHVRPSWASLFYPKPRAERKGQSLVPAPTGCAARLLISKWKKRNRKKSGWGGRGGGKEEHESIKPVRRNFVWIREKLFISGCIIRPQAASVVAEARAFCHPSILAFSRFYQFPNSSVSSWKIFHLLDCILNFVLIINCEVFSSAELKALIACNSDWGFCVIGCL